jgi:hypothetical protein
MTDDELRQQLKGLPVPAPQEGAEERALHRARVAFEAGRLEQPAPASGSHLRWLLLGAVGCLLITAAFVLGRWSGTKEPTDEGRLLAEVQRLFPNQLQAIIHSRAGSDILTSSESSTFSQQPLLVELRENGYRLRIMSFSGQRISVTLHDRPITLEFLLTPDGKVLVAGDNFLWRSDRPAVVDGLQIEARALTARL